MGVPHHAICRKFFRNQTFPKHNVYKCRRWYFLCLIIMHKINWIHLISTTYIRPYFLVRVAKIIWRLTFWQNWHHQKDPSTSYETLCSHLLLVLVHSLRGRDCLSAGCGFFLLAFSLWSGHPAGQHFSSSNRHCCFQSLLDLHQVQQFSGDVRIWTKMWKL